MGVDLKILFLFSDSTAEISSLDLKHYGIFSKKCKASNNIWMTEPK